MQPVPCEQVEAAVDELLEEEEALPGCRPEIGGADGIVVPGMAAQASTGAAAADGPLSLPSSSRQPQPVMAEAVEALKLRTSADAQQKPGIEDASAALAIPQHHNPQQQAWTQQFCDSRLEQRFRLYQASMLRSVCAHIAR